MAEDVTKAKHVATPPVRATTIDPLNQKAEDGEFDNNVFGGDPYK